MFLCQAAVMGGDRVVAQALAQVTRQALGQASGVDEYQRGAMLAGEHREPVVDQAPDIGGHDRAQWHRRYFQSQVALADMTDIDDGAGLSVANQKLRHALHRPLGRGQADTPQRPSWASWWPMPSSGASRLRRMSLDSALSGDT
ncbi:hypothetical protein WR25_02515 [Diploscapter pachys]|uniref:Uncharacterized protein n=1 Tax=Diploscapter pachys TaxID=2018661 RepID=A0A2A2KGU6_9BILA|nr:hypothetical protein WR25_02515 [Diploscapter pachys]